MNAGATKILKELDIPAEATQQLFKLFHRDSADGCHCPVLLIWTVKS